MARKGAARRRVRAHRASKLSIPNACKLGLARLASAGLALLVAESALPVHGLEWSVPIEVASGPAYQGPWRMNASEFHFVDDPSVAIDREGNVAVAWVDQTRHDVLLQVYDATGPRFETPVNVSRSSEIFSWLPRLATGSGAIYMLWQEIVFSGGTHGGEAFFSRSLDGGRSFEPPLNLSDSIAGDGKGRLTRHYWHNGSLDLAVGRSGRIYAVWTTYEGSLWLSRSDDRGVRFSAPLRVAGDRARPARGPSIALSPDEDAIVYVAWTVGEDPTADIHLARSVDGGRSFGDARVVLPSPGHADAPKIASDARGNLHLVYADSPEGPFERYHIRYARRSADSMVFERPRDISTGLAGVESTHFPHLAVDAKGRLLVLFELFSRARYRPRGLAMTYSDDDGKTFVPPFPLPGISGDALGENGSRQGLLMRKLAVGARGTVAVVNSTFDAGASSHVWLLLGVFPGK